ncbi:MAG TPA: peroxiredoxin [Polyangiaceae bacterium]|nr:peroxiredoxin [Polyangiaceae bacterium]
MQHKWTHYFAALICTGAVACQKDAPAPASTQTVTASAKPSPAATPAPAATNTAAQPGSAEQPGSTTGTELKVGDPAPELTLTLQNGKTVDLASLKGQQVAIYFYPKDDTQGCTVEAQGIRDDWAEFQKAGIKVFGVSMQDAASHNAFIEKNKLPFDLVVDHDKKVTGAFGVPVRGGEYAARQTFLIGADGKIKQIWRDVKPQENAKQLLEAAGAKTSEPASPAAPKAG